MTEEKTFKAEEFCGEWRIIDNEGNVVCTFCDANDAKTPELFSAAPELFEALKDVMSAVELGWIPDGESMFNAREAIAKATGA